MNAVIVAKPSNSVVQRVAQRYGVDADKMLSTLKATAFRGEVSNEQMMALLVVADQYELNPWTKEIFAFPDRNNGIVPVVGVDGWSRIINSNQQFDGMSFNEGPLNKNGLPEWIECVIHRKDRAHPVSVKEYFDEVFRDVGPWKTHPRRMLRHKAMIQCARLAFGFAGIYDQDEAERIIDVTPGHRNDPRGDLSTVDYAVRDSWVAKIKAELEEAGGDDSRIVGLVKDYHDELNKMHELYISVQDKLASDKIVSRANWRKCLSAKDAGE